MEREDSDIEVPDSSATDKMQEEVKDRENSLSFYSAADCLDEANETAFCPGITSSSIDINRSTIVNSSLELQCSTITSTADSQFTLDTDILSDIEIDDAELEELKNFALKDCSFDISTEEYEKLVQNDPELKKCTRVEVENLLNCSTVRDDFGNSYDFDVAGKDPYALLTTESLQTNFEVYSAMAEECDLFEYNLPELNSFRNLVNGEICKHK